MLRIAKACSSGTRNGGANGRMSLAPRGSAASAAAKNEERARSPWPGNASAPCGSSSASRSALMRRSEREDADVVRRRECA